MLAALGLPFLLCVALALAVGFSLAPLLLPVRCRVDERGVAQRGPFGWERRGWDEIRRAARMRGGLLVSPFREPRRLDRFRSLLLPMPERRRRELAERVAPRLRRHGLR